MNTMRLMLMAAVLCTAGCAFLAVADPIYEVLGTDDRPLTVTSEECVSDGGYPSPPPNSAGDPAQYIIQCLCLNWDEPSAGFNTSHYHVFGNGEMLSQEIERAYKWCAPEMDTTYGLMVNAVSGDITTKDMPTGPPFYMEWISGDSPPPECVEWSDPALCFDGPLVVPCP